jgi:hypothetical protein
MRGLMAAAYLASPVIRPNRGSIVGPVVSRLSRDD